MLTGEVKTESFSNIKNELDSKSELSVAKNPDTPSNDDEFLPMLKVFYQRLFPFKEFYKWLSYGNVSKNYFANREFSFTLASEAYIRFQSFADMDEMKSELIKMNPVKIDLGAVYNIKPKDKKMFKAGAFQPLERELVFDIDMTDYDEIRVCCKGGDICLKCWDFMTISIQIIDRVLREDFGFKHLLWIYSGRRGVHCWIADERARKLTAEGRKAIVSFIEVVKGGEGQQRKVNLPFGKTSIHPSLLKAQEVLDQHFRKTLLVNQDILGTPEQWAKILALIPDEETRKTLDDYFTKNQEMSSIEKWKVLSNELIEPRKKKSSMATSLRDIIFQYSYPRLDDHVSTGINHLLKSPFCVHPKTGKVCVPIDPKKCHLFNPLTVPTLVELIKEIDSLGTDSSLDGKLDVYERTSLAPYIELFNVFLSGLDESAKEVVRKKRLEDDKKLMF